jgi:hypothetical protein
MGPIEKMGPIVVSTRRLEREQAKLVYEANRSLRLPAAHEEADRPEANQPE